jgi:trans-aconitate methyltransferase
MADAAARRYAGRFARGMARGKLRGDPVYRALIERGVADAPSVTDLGCGRGLLFALILEARTQPLPPVLRGVEIVPRAVRIARAACGSETTILHEDLAGAPSLPADVVTLLDVLHYLPLADHDRLLERAVASLNPGGRLFVREADGGAGPGFRAVQVSERLAALARGEGWRAFAYRPAHDWARRLERLGTSVVVAPMGGGTPFANVLLEARAAA